MPLSLLALYCLSDLVESAHSVGLSLDIPLPSSCDCMRLSQAAEPRACVFSGYGASLPWPEPRLLLLQWLLSASKRDSSRHRTYNVWRRFQLNPQLLQPLCPVGLPEDLLEGWIAAVIVHGLLAGRYNY